MAEVVIDYLPMTIGETYVLTINVQIAGVPQDLTAGGAWSAEVDFRDGTIGSGTPAFAVASTANGSIAALTSSGVVVATLGASTTLSAPIGHKINFGLKLTDPAGKVSKPVSGGILVQDSPV